MTTFHPPRAALLAPAVMALVLLAGCSSDQPVEDVNVAEAAEILDQGDAVILDVRTPAEFAAGHLPGAINIDVEATTFTDQVSGLDETAEVLVYCQSGNRSTTATNQMADLGFTDLANLEGGIQAWTAAGEPLDQ